MRNFVTTVVSRLADLVEFTDAALTADDTVRRAHFSKIKDQEVKMEERLARALGIETRMLLDGAPLPWEDAEQEVSRRRVERKRLMDRQRREREELREEQEIFA